jgi:hypothetical protein
MEKTPAAIMTSTSVKPRLNLPMRRADLDFVPEASGCLREGAESSC